MTQLLVFDSGLGGLSVAKAIRMAMPSVDMLYLADHAGFPYGERSEADILERVCHLVEAQPCDGVVIACNTASTIVLPELRKRLSVPIVGTVPAIKPACAQTKSGLVSVLGTLGTVKREYTHELIAHFSKGVEVNLVGSKNLAALCEQSMRGEEVSDAAIWAEFAPCFIDKNQMRTDIIVLACTHYPFVLPRLKQLAPWVIDFIDPAPAIAKHVQSLVKNEGQGHFHYFSTAQTLDDEALARQIVAY